MRCLLVRISRFNGRKYRYKSGGHELRGIPLSFDGVVVKDLRATQTPNGPRISFILRLRLGDDQFTMFRVMVDEENLRDYVAANATKGRNVSLIGTFHRVRSSVNGEKVNLMVVKASYIRFD